MTQYFQQGFRFVRRKSTIFFPKGYVFIGKQCDVKGFDQ